MKSIRVFAPATIGNLACGFDILGMALHKPGDELTMQITKTSKVEILSVSGDDGQLPLNPLKNTAGVAALAMLKALRSRQGISIRLQKKMPLGSGLGSSAASAAAAVFALNELLDHPFSNEELVRFAMEGERVACGSAHADNVAPALMGGIVLVRNGINQELISLPVPAKLFAVVVHPDIILTTRRSRAVLKKQVPLATVTTQTGHTAAFIAALFRSDYPLIGRSAVDFLAEPQRARLIPGFTALKANAMKKGALACSISGSGPSVFALCDSAAKALAVGRVMVSGFHHAGIESQLYHGPVNRKGVIITG